VAACVSATLDALAAEHQDIFEPCRASHPVPYWSVNRAAGNLYVGL
jgi:hypothetical protein